jgi:hypothetical protein
MSIHKVIRKLGTDGLPDQFWTGGGFSSNYEDAKIYESGRARNKDMKAANELLNQGLSVSERSKKVVRADAFTTASEEAEYQTRLLNLKYRDSANTIKAFNFESDVQSTVNNDILDSDGKLDYDKVIAKHSTDIAQIDQNNLKASLSRTSGGSLIRNNENDGISITDTTKTTGFSTKE